MNAAQFSPWSVDGWKAGARGQEDVVGDLRWDGLRIPQVVAEVLDAVEVPLGSRPQGGWEIQQSFSEKDAMMQGLMHGVEGIRTSAEGVDGEALRALLADVHPEMVALHVDGYDTVGGLARRGGVGGREGGARLEHVGCRTQERIRCRSAEVARRGVARGDAGVSRVGRGRGPMAGPRHASCRCAWRHAQRLERGLNVLVAAGWSLEDAAKHATLRLAFSTDVLSSVAMARAARALWSRLLASMGMAAGAVVRLEAQTSTLGLHADAAHSRDALLSHTVAAYAAVLGGVDGLEVRRHDFREVLEGREDRDEAVRAERWARNIQHILREEAGLGEHADVMKGSRAIEALTRQMAEQAWARHEEMEAAGGWRAGADLMAVDARRAARPPRPAVVRLDRHGARRQAMGAGRRRALFRARPFRRGADARTDPRRDLARGALHECRRQCAEGTSTRGVWTGRGAILGRALFYDVRGQAVDGAAICGFLDG